MKQAARILFIAVLFATLSLPALARERGDEAPTFYQGYHIRNCKATAGGVGEVTATFLYYWDFEAQENRVGEIMFVKSDLAPGYYGSSRRARNSVTVEISERLGLLVSANTCYV